MALVSSNPPSQPSQLDKYKALFDASLPDRTSNQMQSETTTQGLRGAEVVMLSAVTIKTRGMDHALSHVPSLHYFMCSLFFGETKFIPILVNTQYDDPTTPTTATGTVPSAPPSTLTNVNVRYASAITGSRLLMLFSGRCC
jgi:hypothetical protein